MDIYLSEVARDLSARSGQIAVLAACVAAATFLLRRHSAHVRYLLWLIVLAKCLVPPLHVVPLPVLPQTVPRAIPATPSQLQTTVAHRDFPSQVALGTPVPQSQRSALLTQPRPVGEHRLSVSGWLGGLWIGGRRRAPAGGTPRPQPGPRRNPGPGAQIQPIRAVIDHCRSRKEH